LSGVKRVLFRHQGEKLDGSLTHVLTRCSIYLIFLISDQSTLCLFLAIENPGITSKAGASPNTAEAEIAKLVM
jgi:hypothetical protein